MAVTNGSAGIHGLYPGDASRGAAAGGDVRLVVEGAKHLGRGEAGGSGGPEPRGPAQFYSSGPGYASVGGERGGGGRGRGETRTSAAERRGDEQRFSSVRIECRVCILNKCL